MRHLAYLAQFDPPPAPAKPKVVKLEDCRLVLDALPAAALPPLEPKPSGDTVAVNEQRALAEWRKAKNAAKRARRAGR